MKCKHIIECDEPILHVEFELNGTALILALIKTGVYVYRSNDMQVLRHCSLPHSERAPEAWTAYNCFNMLPVKEKSRKSKKGSKTGKIDKRGSEGESAFIGDPHLRIVLAGDNGNLYVWNAVIPIKTLKGAASTSPQGSAHEEDDSHPHESKLLAVVELPVAMSTVVEMSTLHPGQANSQGLHAAASPKQIGDRQTRILALSKEGQALIIDVKDGSFATAGDWAVVMYFSPAKLMATGVVDETDLVTDDFDAVEDNAANAGTFELKTHTVANNDLDQIDRESREFKSYVRSRMGYNLDMGGQGSARQQPLLSDRVLRASLTKPGRVTGTADYIIATGAADGKARIFDLDACLGTGMLAGTLLRHREPRHFVRRHELRRHIHDHHVTPDWAPQPGSVTAGLQASSKAEERMEARMARKSTLAEKKAQAAAISSLEDDDDTSDASSPAPVSALDPAEEKPLADSSELARTMRAARAQMGDAVPPLDPAVAMPKTPLDPAPEPLTISALQGLAQGRRDQSKRAGSSSPSTLTDTNVDRDRSSGEVPFDAPAPPAPEAYRPGVKGGSDLETKRMAKLEQDKLKAAKKREKYEERARVLREKTEAAERRRLAKLEKKRLAEEEGISKRALELFELSTLTPMERVENATGLTNFRNAHGSYPSRYRALIWRFLLQLPENHNAYEKVSTKPVHFAYADLRERYPLQDDTVFNRLQRLCSNLAHWDSMFCEAGVVNYLPQMCFPFVVLYGADEISALETMISIFMYWGFGWYSTYPAEPTHIYKATSNLLERHDKRLSYHLEVLEVSPGELAWAMMSTCFSEVLNALDWLKLMDYLLTRFTTDEAFLLAPVALLRGLRATLLTMDSAKNVAQLVHQQHFFNIDEVIADVDEMCNLSSIADMKILTTARFNGDDGNASAARKKMLKQGRLSGGSDDYIEDSEEGEEEEEEWAAIANSLNDKEDVKADKMLHPVEPVHPLPRSSKSQYYDHYPEFNNYPRHLLDLDMKSKKQSDALEKEIKRRNQVLNKLRKQSEEMESNHLTWMARNSNRGDIELKNRLRTMEKEKQHMLEVMRLEEEISRARVEMLSSVEKAARDELGVIEASMLDAGEFVAQSEQHLDDKMNVALKIQKHRELAENTHLATEERVRSLQLRRSREEFVKSVTQQLQGQEQELEAKNKMLGEEWLRQDEELARKRAERVARAKALAEQEALDRLQDEMTHRMQRLLLQREAKIIEIERSRQIRQAREETDEAIDASERAALALQKEELSAALEKAADLAAKGHSDIAGKLELTMAKIKNESKKLLEEEGALVTKAEVARSEARDALLQKEWLEHKEKLLKGAVVAEGDLQEQYTRLKRSALELELEEIKAAKAAERRALGSGSGGSTQTREGRGSVVMRSEDLRDEYNEVSALGDEIQAHQRARYLEMRDALTAQRLNSSSVSGGSSSSSSSSESVPLSESGSSDAVLQRYRGEQLSTTSRLDPRSGVHSGLRRQSEMRQNAKEVLAHMQATLGDVAEEEDRNDAQKELEGRLPGSSLVNPVVTSRQDSWGAGLGTQPRDTTGRGGANSLFGRNDEFSSSASSSSSSSGSMTDTHTRGSSSTGGSSGGATRDSRTNEPTLWQA